MAEEKMQIADAIRTFPQHCGYVRRRVAKVGHKWGNFGLCWCGWQTVGSAPDEKSFHRVANKAKRVYYGTVFDVKKEIPDESKWRPDAGRCNPY